MSESTVGEQELLSDVNEFVRQTANLTSDMSQSSGLRPHPLIESTEQRLDTVRFGQIIQQQSDEPSPESG